LTPHNFGHTDDYALKFGTFVSSVEAFVFTPKKYAPYLLLCQNRVIKFQAKCKSGKTLTLNNFAHAEDSAVKF
jgi:NRPS condensation-like uncharacterized protein